MEIDRVVPASPRDWKAGSNGILRVRISAGTLRQITLSKLFKNVLFLTQAKMSSFSSPLAARVPSSGVGGGGEGGALRR
ncbi:MAG: hypothetical protein RLZ45_2144, partial [Verrucomicrobiota bacterium]